MNTLLEQQSLQRMPEHYCPYVNEITRRQTGGIAIAAYKLKALMEKAVDLHKDGICPPTHTSPTSPTREWADWVQQAW